MAIGIFKKIAVENFYNIVTSGSFTFGTCPAGFTRLVKELRFNMYDVSFSGSTVIANTMQMQNSSSDVLYKKDMGNFFGNNPFYLPILLGNGMVTMTPGDKFVHSVESNTGSFDTLIKFYFSFYEQVIPA